MTKKHKLKKNEGSIKQCIKHVPHTGKCLVLLKKWNKVKIKCENDIKIEFENYKLK
jgi:hypothetical protein